MKPVGENPRDWLRHHRWRRGRVEWWLRNFSHVVVAWNEGTVEGKGRLVAKLR